MTSFVIRESMKTAFFLLEHGAHISGYEHVNGLRERKGRVPTYLEETWRLQVEEWKRSNCDVVGRFLLSPNRLLVFNSDRGHLYSFAAAEEGGVTP